MIFFLSLQYTVKHNSKLKNSLQVNPSLAKTHVQDITVMILGI